MSWTRAHSRLVDAWCDLYRIHACRGRQLRTLESWLGSKFGRPHGGRWDHPRVPPPLHRQAPDLAVAKLTTGQARQARRCLRSWAWADGFGARTPARRP